MTFGEGYDSSGEAAQLLETTGPARLEVSENPVLREVRQFADPFR